MNLDFMEAALPKENAVFKEILTVVTFFGNSYQFITKKPPKFAERQIKWLEKKVNEGSKKYRIYQQASKVVNRSQEKEQIFSTFENAKSGVLSASKNTKWFYGVAGVGKSHLIKFILEINEDFGFELQLFELGEKSLQEVVLEKLFQVSFHSSQPFSSNNMALNFLAKKWVTYFSNIQKPNIVVFDLEFPYTQSRTTETFINEIFLQDSQKSSEFNYGINIFSGYLPESSKINLSQISPLNEVASNELAIKYLTKNNIKYTKNDLKKIYLKSKGFPGAIRSLTLDHDPDNLRISLQKQIGKLNSKQRHVFWHIVCLYSNPQLGRITEHHFLRKEIIVKMLQHAFYRYQYSEQEIELFFIEFQSRDLIYFYNGNLYLNDLLRKNYELIVSELKAPIIYKKIFEWIRDFSELGFDGKPISGWYLINSLNPKYVISQLEFIHDLIGLGTSSSVDFIRYTRESIEQYMNEMDEKEENDYRNLKKYITSFMIVELKASMQEKHVIFAKNSLTNFAVELDKNSLNWVPSLSSKESIYFNLGNISFLSYQVDIKPKIEKKKASLDENLDKALFYYNKALEFCPTGNSKLLINILRMISHVELAKSYLELNLLDSAQKRIDRAFKIYYDNVVPHDYGLLGNLFATEAALYEEFARKRKGVFYYRKALDLYLKSLEYIEKTNNLRYLSVILHNLGNVNSFIAHHHFVLKERNLHLAEIQQRFKSAENFYNKSTCFKAKIHLSHGLCRYGSVFSEYQIYTSSVFDK